MHGKISHAIIYQLSLVYSPDIIINSHNIIIGKHPLLHHFVHL